MVFAASLNVNVNVKEEHYKIHKYGKGCKDTHTQKTASMQAFLADNFRRNCAHFFSKQVRCPPLSVHKNHPTLETVSWQFAVYLNVAVHVMSIYKVCYIATNIVWNIITLYIFPSLGILYYIVRWLFSLGSKWDIHTNWNWHAIANLQAKPQLKLSLCIRFIFHWPSNQPN